MNKVPEGWIAEQRHPSIQATAIALKQAREAYEQATAAARAECKHTIIFETPYRKNDWLASQPPFRVCICCGFREGGWGCGYHALADDPTRMILSSTRDEALALATEPERVSGWWIIPHGKTELRDPYLDYPEAR